MKKMLIVSLLILSLAMALLTGCGGDDSADSNALKNKVADKSDKMEEQMEEKAAKEAKKEASQELVNFKCVIADVQTIYFFKDKAKLETPNAVGWLTDEAHFVKMNFDGVDYLVQYPAEESEMDFEGMMNTYAVSKTSDNIDCNIGVVTEEDVTPPDLEILDEDEFQQKLSDQMMAGLGDMEGMEGLQ